MAKLPETILSICATTSSKIDDLEIKNGQLTFIYDTNEIVLDLNNKRTFYNEIITLESDQDRTSLLAPISGRYYFIIETCVLWFFKDGWKQITLQPEEIIHIGTSLPEIGKSSKVYIDINKKELSVWDEDNNQYITVSNVANYVVDSQLSSTSTNPVQNKVITEKFATKAEVEDLNTLERTVGENTTNIAFNAEAIAAERKRIDTFISLNDGTTTGDAELIDGRIGADGTEYESIGTAIRMQIADINEECATIPNTALLSGNYIKFYKTDGEVYSFLFELDVQTLLEGGLSLENLTLSTEQINNATVLTLSDGTNEKSIEIPIPVDESLLLTSNNPVQNRVVTEQINYIIEEIENIKENGIGGDTGVTVRLTNQNGTSTLVGSYGNAISLMFTFTSTDNDLPTGNGNLKITVNGATKVNMSIPQGLTSIDVAPYLSIGSNTVIVTCTDVYGKSRNLSYDVTVVKLSIESTFNASVPYENDILFKYTPYGSVEKTIHFVVDGTEIGNVVTSLSGKQMTRTIPKMSHGSHKLEVYSTASLNDINLESSKLSYDIMCLESGNTTPMITSVYNEDTITQGEQVSIPYIVYDPTRLSCDVTLTIFTKESGNEVVYNTQKITVDRSQQYWNTRQYPIGDVYFRIKYGDITKVHNLTVTENKIVIKAETNDLELMLSSDGRSNNETTPSQWTYGDVTTTFENMNWNSVGWIPDENGDTCLRLNGDAKATINFQPFAEDIRTYGKTIELEFVIRDVNNRDAVPISCMSGDIGFEVKADTAYLRSEQSEVFCNYKEEERVHLAFVIESKDEYRMLSVYLNGVMSDAIQYPATDNFQQTNPVSISVGSPYCGVDLYKVRSYTTALTDSTLTTNFIADINDIIRKTEAYEDNDIYDEFGQISFTKAREKNSVMVIIGDLPTYKGDKKTCKINYYDVEDSNLDWSDTGVSIDVQGTSSQWYVRKNWKLKTPNEHHIDIDQLPGNVICIKVDYAEATGTHNTQNAVFVEKLYSEKVPPQEVNPKVRTTIYGKPILLFHQEAEGIEPVFYGKANYNWDKGAENVFGFTSDYDVECWEFCNNTSDACLFRGEIPEDWSEDFEARYPDKYKNISRFKIMHDWVVSTRQDTATGNALTEVYKDADGNEYENDTAEYRLAKFKTEFEDYFNMHYSLVYYVYTFFALMTDQRAKNMFLTYWGNTGKYYPYFYDNDTSWGINNEGGLVFDYYHEDSDQINGANVYNGQNSTLWINFRQAFPDLIKETYQDLRSNSVLNYEELINQFITKGSDKWSESIYNEDGDFKYVSMLRSDNDATNLPQVRGTGEEHLRYFIENRLNYCDSKWYAGKYPDDNAIVRIYTPVDENGTPRTDLAIDANASITVTPYSNMYAGVRYKANGTLVQERLEANETFTFVAPNETFNDTETAIYGASQLSSLGDLAPLYLGYIDVGAAKKLVELKIGDGTEGYQNNNLYHLAVGSNRLLKKIDIQNCVGFDQALVLTGCPNIEEVYAKGSGITGVELPDAGYLKVLQLPATISNLTLKNQHYIEDLTIEGYNKLKTITIENTPVDTLDILNRAVNVERVRLTNVDWHYEDASILYEFIDRKIGGINENGVNIDTMWIDGKCHIDNLTGNELAEIKRLYPYLEITYTTLTSQLIFMSEDGETELSRQTILNGGNGTCPVANGTIETPTKEATAQYTFDFSGWSKVSGGDVDDTALLKVESDRYVYAAYSKTIQVYTVNFYNGDTFLETHQAEYGTDVTYGGKTPTNDSTGNINDFEFIGWKPEPTNIQGNTNCYAQYYDKREITDSWEVIAKACSEGTATSKYKIGSYKPLYIGAIELPYIFSKGSSVVYNNEIHILGGIDNYRSHYKYNGTEWVEVSTLPINHYCDSGTLAVVYDNEIHMFNTNATIHYKWNGSSWVSVSTLPSNKMTVAVVYNNEIHMFDNNYHYKWDGTTWTTLMNVPVQPCGAVVFNNNIYIFNTKYQYIFNGSSWSDSYEMSGFSFVGDARVVVYNEEIYFINSSGFCKKEGLVCSKIMNNRYMSQYGCMIVNNGNIFLLGGNSRSFYEFNGKEFLPIGTTETINMEVIAHNHDELADGIRKWEIMPNNYNLPVKVDLRDNMILYNNSMHIFIKSRHFVFNNTEWIELDTLPFDSYESGFIEYNGELHAFGGSNNNTAHYKYDGTTWSEVGLLPVESDALVKLVVYNNEIYTKLKKTSYIYKYDGATWSEIELPVSTAMLSSNSISCFVFNDELYFDLNKNMYKYIDTSFVFVGTHSLNDAKFFVYQNELYAINTQYIYKYINGELVCLDKTPVIFNYINWGNRLVIYDNEIHVTNNSKVYKWSGAAFEESVGEKLLNIAFSGLGNFAFEYNNKLYVLTNKLYSWDGAEWIEVTTVPTNFNNNEVALYNNEIYLCKSTNQPSDIHYCKLYKYDWNTWTEVTTLPVVHFNGAMVEYNGCLHFIGGNYTKTHHIWDGTEWTETGNFPFNGYPCEVVVYNNEIHLFTNQSGNHYKYNGTEWIKASNVPWGKTAINIAGGKKLEVYNNAIYINAYPEGIYKWDGVEWEKLSTPKYNFTHSALVTFRNKLRLIGGAYATANHYILENPKATLTFFAKNLLKDNRQMNSVSMDWTTNYTDTDLRSWLNNDLFNSFPSTLQNNAQEVIKYTGRLSNNSVKEIVKTNEKCWLISDEETGWNQLYSLKGEGEVYDVFTDNNSRKRSKIECEPEDWWVRSTYFGNANRFGRVQANGVGTHGTEANKLFGVCFGFCI